MAKLLKKADILNGINKPQKHFIKSLNGELWLRPLSNHELDLIEEEEAKAMGTIETNERGSRRRSESTSKGKLNVAKVTRASAESKIEKIYRSLDNSKNQGEEAWDYDEINSLRKNTVEEIVQIVDEISGVNVTQSDVENFPENE